jgi:predicted metalloprotease with PDZ domain
VTERRRQFDRGYDAAATRLADGVIAGVAPDGPAYAAGMRDGMRLVRREAGKVGDSTVEMAYRVSDGTDEKVIRFRPEGKGEFEVQHLEITAAGPEQEARCKARLGGGTAQ